MKTEGGGISGGPGRTWKVAHRKAGRPRVRSAIFGAYVVATFLVAYLFSDRLTAGWYDPSMIRWFLGAFAVSGAIVLVGLGVGVVGRRGAIDLKLDELIDAQRARYSSSDVSAAANGGTPVLEEIGGGGAPSDQDVEQLLVDLEHVSRVAEASEMEEDELVARLSVGDHADVGRRRVAREIRRLSRIRDAIGSHIAGPTIAGLLPIGASAALMPAADGTLLVDVPLSQLVVVAGIAYTTGLAVYAAIALRRSGAGI